MKIGKNEAKSEKGFREYSSKSVDKNGQNATWSSLVQLERVDKKRKMFRAFDSETFSKNAQNS